MTSSEMYAWNNSLHMTSEATDNVHFTVHCRWCVEPASDVWRGCFLLWKTHIENINETQNPANACGVQRMLWQVVGVGAAGNQPAKILQGISTPTWHAPFCSHANVPHYCQHALDSRLSLLIHRAHESHADFTLRRSRSWWRSFSDAFVLVCTFPFVGHLKMNACSWNHWNFIRSTDFVQMARW